MDWKSKVINHHQEVPFRVLERKYSFDENGQHDEDNGSENMIIRGDNLEALKALLPRYEGRVKCIYIDPPYNTGNEGWVYNDNVNDPKIKKWLGEVVGKEGEDLTRHDKWLCMMYPRLKLLQKLLADDGAIFISIDDTEISNLRLLMDEVFGANNFVTTVIWHKNYAPKSSAKFFSEDHDYITVYAKNKMAWIPNLLPRTEEQDKIYKNPDNDPRGLWRPDNLSARNPYSLGLYSITCPGGRVIPGPLLDDIGLCQKKSLSKWMLMAAFTGEKTETTFQPQSVIFRKLSKVAFPKRFGNTKKLDIHRTQKRFKSNF